MNLREQPRGDYARYGVLAGVGLLLLSLPYLVPTYFAHLLILAGLESIVVMGFVVQLRVGLLSFAIATMWGIGAYISALASTTLGIDFWLCLPLSAMGTALIAFIIGLIIIRAGGVTFLMITIVMAEIFVEAVGHLSVLGGWQGIWGIHPPTIGSFVFVSKVSYYYLTLGLVMLCALIFYALYRSPIGAAWTAIGRSSDLAASVGINLFRYRLAAYVIAAFTVGLSGSVYAHYMCFLVPQSFDIVRSIYLLIYGLVGGIGFTIAGPIIGSVTMNLITEVLRVGDKYQPIFLGGVIVLVALLFRNGILGALPRYITHGLWRRWGRSNANF